MSLLLIGLNHQTAPIGVRERLAFSSQQLEEALGLLKTPPGVSEIVLLSTCNRTELYASALDAETDKARLTAWLTARVPATPLESHLYHYENQAAVKHLFRVAAGLDSMVVGENEILAQVKQAYQTAQQLGATGKLLNVLFQRSLYVGKRVRTETGLSVGASSVGSLAASMAERIFGSLHERAVMIMGAGEMAETTARHLMSLKIQSLVVVNRTLERAQALAAQFGGRAVPFENSLDEMENADIILCSLASTEPVITPEQISELMPKRKGRSLFFVDIGVPRNVHPDVHAIDNVYVYNIDDLQSLVHENLSRRSQETQRAEAIVQEKTSEFERWLGAYAAGEEHSLRHGGASGSRTLPALSDDR